MATTNLTSAEMNGSGSLGPTLTDTIKVTYTNVLNSNFQFPAGYITFEANATANQNLAASANLGDRYFFVPQHGGASDVTAVGVNYQETGLSLPYKTNPNTGSANPAIMGGLLFAQRYPYEFSQESTDLFNIFNPTGCFILQPSPLTNVTTTATKAAGELLLVDADGNDTTISLPADASLEVVWGANQSMTSMTLSFSGILEVAMGFELTVVNLGLSNGAGFRIISKYAFKADVGFTFTDPYYIKSTGNASLILEDV